MGIIRECDTFTCVHCNGVVFVGVKMIGAAPGDDPDLGGYCTSCDAPICSGCAGKECRPFKAWLEHAESATTARVMADLQYERMLKDRS